MTTQNGKQVHEKQTQEKPAKPDTPGYANDPRAKAADNLERDNENRLDEQLDKKHDKTGG